MAAVTLYKNFIIPYEVKHLMKIMDIIKSDEYKDIVFKIQQLKAEGKDDEADALKKTLPAFTASCRCEGGRNIDLATFYTAFIILDIDHLSQEEIARISALLSSNEYVFAYFKSCSGAGLKILIETNGTQENHESTYNTVADQFEELLKVKIDRSGKDVVRLCFMSHDPDAYKNIGNKKFIVENKVSQLALEIPIVSEVKTETIKSDYIEKFDYCIQLTENKKEFSKGERNNYVYLLANNCNRNGIPKEDAYTLIISRFDFNSKEVRASIDSAYNHHNEFAKYANRANGANVQTEQEYLQEDYLKSTPTIPQSIYDGLPYIFQEGSRVIDDPRMRDVQLTAALAIMSGCLPNVTGIYHQERVHPHLYVFIVAPAASGKGTLKYAKQLADKLHQNILEASKKAKNLFDGEMADYKQELSNKKKGSPVPEKPEQPPFQVLIIPANCSQARMIEHLSQNNGRGIICESEADTMSNTNKNDWGDYSTILRAAWHHETIAITRKTNNEYLEIQHPELAMALTGTPAQVFRLITSAEDGLVSRMMFYAYKTNQLWRDPSPNASPVIYNDHFDKLSDLVVQYAEQLEKSPTNIYLTSSQWEILNSTFASLLNEVITFTSEDASSIVYRLGLITFRLCMIFTALRKCENGEDTNALTCTDQDFNSAIELAKIYLQHSLLVFNTLPNQDKPPVFKKDDNKQKFFDALPIEFYRHEAIEIGKSFGLRESTIDHNFLSKLVPTHLTKPKPGFYKKIIT